MSFTRTGATALVLWLTLLSMVSAQQSTLSIENAKKEAEVVWYGTLTGGSIVGRILGHLKANILLSKLNTFAWEAPDSLKGSGVKREMESTSGTL